ncbi:MAG: ROK family protein [Solirubrobacterales bacterium]
MNRIETIGADLGGTKLAVGVVDDQPETVWSNEVPSKGYSQESVIDLLAEQINLAHEQRPQAVAAGVGIPATLDFESGYAISTVNLDLEDLPVRDLLSEKVRIPTFIDNDGNVAMLAEALYGAARGTKHALLLTLGTGIGGGIWVDGKVFRGSRGAGAELGHTVVEIDGPKCQGNCRGRGCVEIFASGSAIGKAGQEAAEREPDSVLGKMAVAGQKISGREVTAAAHAGDEAAIAVIETAGHYLGNALVSLSNVFQPEVIVLGGGAMAMGELILEPARKELRDRALRPMDQTKVVAAELGPAAGMIGAAALARIEMENAG